MIWGIFNHIAAGWGWMAKDCRGKGKKFLLCLLFSLLLGCNLSFLPAPPLNIAAAQHTLNHWNPQYCKVIEFYGLHQPAAPDTRLAYMLIANPKDPAAKPVLSVAQFQLLTLPDGNQEWFLTSLVSHSGGLTRRQGWDNLMIPVKIEPLAVVE
jgi:hypothetical protein